MEPGSHLGILEMALLLLVFCLGASIGSFLNVCIYRLPAGRSIVRPRSQCPNCRNTIPWHDNIPVVSWFLLGARCRYCGVPISWRYPVVEAATGLFAVLYFEWFSPSLEQMFLAGEIGGLVQGAIYFAMTCALLVVALIDIDHQIVPNEITLPGIFLGLAASFVLPIRFHESLLGALAGGGILLAVARAYFWVTRREGMGMGDVKLLAMIGAFLGWAAIPFTLLFSSVTGMIYGIFLIKLRGRGFRYAFAFGPFLCLSAVVYVFYGREIIGWYLGRF